MSESIAEIKADEESLDEQQVISKLLLESAKPISEAMAAIKALSESGILSMIASFASNYQDVLAELMDGLTDDRMENFMLNLSSIFTLLSRLPPGMVRGFMENAASEMNGGNDEKNLKPLGLLSMLSLFKDSDASAGLRILVGTMKGFTKQTRKEGT
ncbi:MAG: DUF1641 domain-containing protein [Thermoplasmataceae archaeon]